MKTNRRNFLGRWARSVATAGFSLGAAAWLRPRTGLATEGSGENHRLPIVDTHQHLWDLSKLRLPWLKPGGPLTRSYLMEDYLAATQGLNVVKAVYMEVAVADDMLTDEARLVIDICRRGHGPTVAAVIGGRPAEEGFRKYITQFKGSPYVKGVRHILPAGEPQLWRRKSFIAGIRLLGQLGMSFDLCMPPDRMEEAIRLVDQCSETRFILDHCGNADPVAFMSPSRRKSAGVDRRAQHEPAVWQRGIGELATRSNVVCKISGIVARAPKGTWVPEDLAPIVNHCLEVFGPDRVMFASDWPVCTRAATLRQWVEALQHIVADRPEVERRKLFAENAVRFYGLATTDGAS